MTSISEKSINNSLTRANSAEIAGFAMPSNAKYEDLTLGANETTYTAPANGYVQFTRYGANIYTILGVLKEGETVVTDEAIVYRAADTTNFNTATDCLIPIKKGATFFTNYGGTANLLYFRFIYAEGEA